MSAAPSLPQIQPLPAGLDLGSGPLALLRAMQTFSDPLQTMIDLTAKHGDTYSVRIGNTTMLLVSRPEHMHAVLVEHADAFYKSPDYSDPQRGIARFVGQGLPTAT